METKLDGLKWGSLQIIVLAILLAVHFVSTRKFRALCTPYPPTYTSEEVNKHVQPMIRAKLIEEHKVIYIGTICKVRSLADH
jgi:hypothetical protein